MGTVLIVTLTPWIIRNYNIFEKFIPLTYGMRNPLLLGTYQGVGYPLDEELDYKTNVDDKMPEEMRYYVENSDEKPYMTRYYRLEYDGMKAKYRMEEWWKRNPKSMIKSYCYFKPIILIHNTFYWDTFFRIKGSWLMLIRKYEIILTVICGIIALFNKERFKEILLLGSLYISQIALYSYSFAFDRYGMSLIFIRYIIIGIGLEIIYENIKNIFKSRKLSVKTLKEKF